MTRLLFLLSLFVAVLEVSARRMPGTTNLARRTGANVFRYPYGWGLDTPKRFGCTEEVPDPESSKRESTRKVKAVKRGTTENAETSIEIPMKRGGLSNTHTPYLDDHWDDIFLSSAGVDQ